MSIRNSDTHKTNYLHISSRLYINKDKEEAAHFTIVTAYLLTLFLVGL